jgi:hypothetical protein
MKLRHWLPLLLALPAAGCVSTAELPGRVNFQAPLPPNTQSVAIRALAMKPGTIKNVEGLADAPQLLSRYVRDALALKRPAWKITVVDDPQAAADAEVAVTLELLGIEGGSAALRFWIGLGTGATQSAVRVTTADKAGKELASATITERTICPVGACVEANDATVRRNLQNLAMDIAEFVLDPVGYEQRKREGS